MKALKITATVILGIVLFLSLFVFGIAFNLKMTVLNPNFIAAEIDKVPISEIFLDNSAFEMDIPAELKASLDKTVVAIEPQLKEEAGNAVKSVYDYLLGKKDNPELAQTLRRTMLSDSFFYTLVDNVDLGVLLGQIISDGLENAEIPPEFEPLIDRVEPVLIEAEPQLKARLKAAAPDILDYVLGLRDSFTVSFTLDDVVDELTLEAKNILRNNPAYAGLSDAQIDDYIDRNLPQLIDIFEAFTFDQSTLGSEAQVTEALQEAENSLAEVRPYILQFQTYFIWLIVFIIVVAGGIVALNLSVRKATRAIGAVLVAYGFIEFVPLLIAKFAGGNYLNEQILADAPVYLETYAIQRAFDFIAPLFWFSLGCLIAGIALLVVSFVYRPLEPAEAEQIIVEPPATNEPPPQS